MNMAVFAEGFAWKETVLTAAFGYGVVAGVVLVLLLWCLLKLFSGPRASSPAIIVSDDTLGSFSVSTAAIHSFVQRIMMRFPALGLKAVSVQDMHDGKALVIQMAANADCPVAEIRRQLRSKLLESLDQQLGIKDQIKAINIEISDFHDNPQAAICQK